MARTFYRLRYFFRYRFLLFAGIFPYLLGSAIGLTSAQPFNLELFLMGLVGLIFVLMGVETFNEYFDWVLGTDRVFQVEPRPVSKTTFLIGLVSFAIAGVFAIYLARHSGLPIIIISILGFLAALFYLSPPLKLAYRGLGELVIALSYGPLMMSGAYYLQRHQLDGRVVLISIIPALLLFMIALMNEVPDYYQDKLVGKRNICVRLGRKKVVSIYGGLLVIFHSLFMAALLTNQLPRWAWLALLASPAALTSYLIARRTYDNPRRFIPALRYLLIHYLVTLTILAGVYLI